ncbi:hypothetical protein PG984_009608 [Apiospora sp. TS-2023a]
MSELDSDCVLDPLLDMVSVAEKSDVEPGLSVAILGKLVVSGTPESVDVVIGDAAESVVDGSVMDPMDEESGTVDESASKEDVDS